MFTFDLIQCGLLVLCLMAAGEAVSHKLKAIIPSILASAVLFVVLLWSGILPENLIEDSGLMHLTSIAMMFTIIGMGASLNLRELLDNWRVVALTAISYFGQVLILLLTTSTLFGRNTAIGALPGGAAVALIIQERARALGLEQIVVLSVLLVAVQGLVACPIVSWMLRREVMNMQKRGIVTQEHSTADYCDNHRQSPNRHSPKKLSKKFVQDASSIESHPRHPQIHLHVPHLTKLEFVRSHVPPFHAHIPHTPHLPTSDSRANQSPYWSLLRFYVAAWTASRLELYTGISRYVYCLLLGVLFTQIGFLSGEEMQRSKSQGLLSLMMMITVLNGFSGLTPQMFADLLGPLVCILLTDIISIFLMSFFLGKLLKFSKHMSFALCLNVMIGFPLNLMLAQDIIAFLARDEEEKKILNQQIASKMVIGGFTSMTFLSTIGAGLMVNYFLP